MAGMAATSFTTLSSSSATLRRSPTNSVNISPKSFVSLPNLRRSLPNLRRALPKLPVRFRRAPKILAFTSNDIKVGINIEVDGAPWKVLEFLHVKPGKGAAFVRTKIRNYVTGSTVEKTFRAGISMSEADVSKETKQFTYKDGDQFVFMDLTTYEETRLNDKDVGDKKKWLKEGMDCNLIFWKDKVIDFELPITVKMTVASVGPGLKGDTVQGATKQATLDSGVVVNVPLFVNTGDEILVDTRIGQYMSRV